MKMKKLIALSYTILCSVLLVLCYVNFSYDVLENVENGKQKIVIKKGQLQTNEEFLQSLDESMREAGLDIMYKYVEVDGDSLTYNYYMTNNTSDFAYKEAADILPNVAYDGLKNAKCYDLTSGIYYVRKDQCDQTVNAIQRLGYQVTMDTTVEISGKSSIFIFASIPIILVIISMVFYVLSIGKKTVLRKMEGHTTLEILTEEFSRQIPFYIFVAAVLEGIALGAVLHQYRHAVVPFLKYESGYALLGVVALLSGMAISSVAVHLQNRVEYIKGKVPKKGMYVVSMCCTVAFISFIVFFMTIAVRNVRLYYDTYKTSRFMAEKINGYVTIPIYENSASSEGLEGNYLEFYKQTVDEFQGVLIHAGNYRYDLASGTTMCDKYGQDWITVNENYLRINPIYDREGDEVELPSEAGQDVVNVLVPISKADEKGKYASYVRDGYHAEANFIDYDEEKTQVYSYNAAIGNGAYGEIESPVIIVVKEENLAGVFVLGYCSSGSYFLRASSADPYKELKPVLEKTGIIIVTPQTPYIASNYKLELAQQADMLKLYGFQTLFLSIGTVFLIIFSAMLFCENYRRKIAANLIEGESIWECIKCHMAFKISIYFISVFVAFAVSKATQVGMNYYIIAAMLLADAIATYILCSKITRRNVYQIVKGDE